MILNGKTTNPGELRTSITLQQRTVTQDAGGAGSLTWSTIATVWARWVNAHSSADILAAQAAQVEAPATVLIRYRSGLDTTCAVLKGADRYDIISIDDIQERHEWLELKVQRIRSA